MDDILIHSQKIHQFPFGLPLPRGLPLPLLVGGGTGEAAAGRRLLGGGVGVQGDGGVISRCIEEAAAGRLLLDGGVGVQGWALR